MRAHFGVETIPMLKQKKVEKFANGQGKSDNFPLLPEGLYLMNGGRYRFYPFCVKFFELPLTKQFSASFLVLNTSDFRLPSRK